MLQPEDGFGTFAEEQVEDAEVGQEAVFAVEDLPIGTRHEVFLRSIGAQALRGRLLAPFRRFPDVRMDVEELADGMDYL